MIVSSGGKLKSSFLSAPVGDQSLSFSPTKDAKSKTSHRGVNEDVKPTYLTIASINRYAGDCAARATKEKHTRPAPRKLVWKWYDIADIPAMIQVCTCLMLPRRVLLCALARESESESASERKREKKRTRELKGGEDLRIANEMYHIYHGFSPLLSLQQTSREVCEDLQSLRDERERELESEVKEERLHQSNRGPKRSPIASAMAVIKNVRQERAALNTGSSMPRSRAHLRASGASLAHSRASHGGIPETKEDLLIAACGSLLAANHANMANTEVSIETSRRSKSVPKPRTVRMTNVSASRGLPDGLSTPVTGLYSLAGVGRNRVEWAETHREDVNVITFHVKTPESSTRKSRPATQEFGAAAQTLSPEDRAAIASKAPNVSLDLEVAPAKKVRGWKPNTQVQ